MTHSCSMTFLLSQGESRQFNREKKKSVDFLSYELSSPASYQGPTLLLHNPPCGHRGDCFRVFFLSCMLAPFPFTPAVFLFSLFFPSQSSSRSSATFSRELLTIALPRLPRAFPYFREGDCRTGPEEMAKRVKRVPHKS